MPFFSKARIPSFQFTETIDNELKDFVTEGMRLWRALDLSVAPKPHAIEDHLCDQMGRLLGIGDHLGEDFVEQSHQSGIKYNSWSRTIKDAIQVTNCKCN